MNVKGFLRLIWPFPSREQIVNPENIYDSYYANLKDFSAQNTTVVNAKVLELSKDLFKEEEKRRLNIESKAATFLNTLAILVPLIIGIATLMLNVKMEEYPLLTYIIIGCYIVLIIYLVKAILVALEVFGKFTKYYIGPNELLSGEYDNEDIFIKKLIKCLVEYTIKNYKVNNRQQDYIIIAQACLRNAIFLLSFIGLLLLLKIILGQFALPIQSEDLIYFCFPYFDEFPFYSEFLIA